MEERLLADAAVNRKSRPFVKSSTMAVDEKEPRDVKVLRRLEVLKERTDFMDGSDRKRCVALLWMGSVFGMCGYTFAFLIGLLQYLFPAQLQGMEFPSGNGYFPSSIAEMVHNPHEPSGKVYFGFCFVSGMFLFSSWYPWELANVYTGDDERVPGMPGVAWPMLRQYMPPLGYMISVCITAKPWAKVQAQDLLTTGINRVAQAMFVLGYIICEYHVLWGCKGTKAKIKPIELIARKSLLWWTAALSLGFCVVHLVESFMPIFFPDFPKNHPWFGTYDEWGPNTDAGLESVRESSGVVLVNTATGFYFLLKLVAYTCDSFSGLSIMWSHFMIWMWCNERWVDISNEIIVDSHSINLRNRQAEGERKAEDKAASAPASGHLL